MRNKIVYSIIIFGIGATLGKLFNWGYFELSKEIKIIDALTLFFTIGIGFYVASVLQREVQNDRVEKDIFLSKISEIESHLTTIESIVEDNNVAYLKVNNQIQQCGIKKNQIDKNKQSLIKKLQKEEVKTIDDNIKKKIRRFKRLLTETPIASISGQDVVIINGQVTYSSSRIVEIISMSNSIKEDLFRLKIIINLA